ncbi:MAG: hypothetical protein RMK29_03210 [Myxococcales bacterium]|nr:hypothetical protein [Myxococcota bacterium]MDW8280693.1 hypothetical protein [Myxococcales bacterium]
MHAPHCERKLHRDIKPTNVVDFGLIMALIPVCEQSSDPVGTPAYMARSRRVVRAERKERLLQRGGFAI